MSGITLPCAVCSIELEPAFPDSARDQPNGQLAQPNLGVVFRASGNFGSTVFDEDHGELELNICDKCLIAIAAKGTIRWVIEERHTIRKATWWAP